MTTFEAELAVLAALTGLVAGSFVNLVATRLPKGQSIAWDRSRADCCGGAARFGFLGCCGGGGRHPAQPQRADRSRVRRGPRQDT